MGETFSLQAFITSWATTPPIVASTGFSRPRHTWLNVANSFSSTSSTFYPIQQEAHTLLTIAPYHLVFFELVHF